MTTKIKDEPNHSDDYSSLPSHGPPARALVAVATGTGSLHSFSSRVPEQVRIRVFHSAIDQHFLPGRNTDQVTLSDLFSAADPGLVGGPLGPPHQQENLSDIWTVQVVQERRDEDVMEARRSIW